MERRKILAGNWKMNLSLDEAVMLCNALLEDERENHVDGELILFPSFPYLQPLGKLTINSGVKIGAQNVSKEAKGAFTGEVSAQMIKDCGAAYVIIAHSERREIFHEQDADFVKKIELSLKNELSPVFCFGENEVEREKDRHFEVVDKQLENVLSGFTQQDLKKMVLAYEPVWAIGTGLTATPEQVEEMHAFVRKWLEQHFSHETAISTSILYGGSCKPENAKEIFEQENIDGGLIGGASLKAESFIRLKEILF